MIMDLSKSKLNIQSFFYSVYVFSSQSTVGVKSNCSQIVFLKLLRKRT